MAGTAGAQDDKTTDPLRRCGEVFSKNPDDAQSADCFYDESRRSGTWDEAERRLRSYLEKYPTNPSLLYSLARIRNVKSGSTPSSEVEQLYQESIDGFSQAGEKAPEIRARLSRVFYLQRIRNLEEASEELARASLVAEKVATEEPELLALVLIRRAQLLRSSGRDLDFAYSLLKRAESLVFPDGPDDLRLRCLDALAAVSYELNHPEETRIYRRRMLEVALVAGDRSAESIARFNLAVLFEALARPSDSARQEFRELLEDALEVSIVARRGAAEANTRRMLGRLVGGAAGRAHLDACIAIAQPRNDIEPLCRCLDVLSRMRVDEDPEGALALLYKALETAFTSENLWAMLYGWFDRLAVLWSALPREEAIDKSMVLLEILERVRDQQGSGRGRAGLQSAWIDSYNAVTGYLLSGHLPPRETAELKRVDLERAWSVLERRRARVLLEDMTLSSSSDAEPTQTSGSPQTPSGSPEDRLADLWTRSESAGRPETAGPEDLASLAEVEAALSAREALLSFQIGLWENLYGDFAGGSWLWVTTRAGTRVYRLADRHELEPSLSMVLRLAQPDQASGALERLHQELLGQAIEDLPAQVDRLIVIPDGVLHLLPLALLRSSADRELLLERYELSTVPSATLWSRWRSMEAQPHEEPALALADPAFWEARDATVSRTDEPRGAFRSWELGQASDLAPLPFARQEGKAVIRELGGQLLVGVDASERFLKESDLGRFAVLHFATHAVVFEDNPGRSAVLLAPGATDEDGALQPHEIVALDVEGQLVVLASCESAGGELLRSEGITSLARAFFQAGARAVVGSLKRLPDETTSALFRDFYKSLGGGASVNAALAEAQRRQIRAGVPAEDWAGLVALGDGELVPFPGGIEKPIFRARPGFAVWLAVAAVLVLGFAAFFRRRNAAG